MQLSKNSTESLCTQCPMSQKSRDSARIELSEKQKNFKKTPREKKVANEREMKRKKRAAVFFFYPRQKTISRYYLSLLIYELKRRKNQEQEQVLLAFEDCRWHALAPRWWHIDT